ncbi:MAG TPA: hypothetical protein VGQ37_02265 [Vicinamibacterales bacterium]|nr:hypothetical protein [Vicinamibacterales bacterium]
MTPRLAAACVLLLATAGCSASAVEAPSRGFPNQMAFDDELLQLKTVYRLAERSLASYARKEEDLPADLQVGVVVSRKAENDEELSTWLIDEYRSSPGQSYHLEVEPNWACKVGLTPGTWPPRAYIAIHLCRQGARGTSCAEVEERITPDELTRCINNYSCWEAMCGERWKARSESVEAVIRNAVGER